MPEMQPVAINVFGVSKSVSLSLCCAKMAEWIEVLFGDQRYIVLHGGSQSLTARGGGFDVSFAKLLCPLVIHGD